MLDTTYGTQIDTLVSHFGLAEVMLPCQYNQRTVQGYDSERRLWLRVLERMLEDWKAANAENGRLSLSAKLRLRLELETWFLSADIRPGAFLWLCDVFKLDAGAVRRKLLGSCALQIVG